MPEALAADFERQMASKDLVFLTPENEKRIEKDIGPEVREQLERQRKIAAEEAIKESDRMLKMQQAREVLDHATTNADRTTH